MVVALIIVGTYIKPQHKLSNLCGHKKDEELRYTYKDKDREITMVLGTQQSSEKFSRFVLQQQKLQQHVYALGSYDSAAHKFISNNPELDFSRFESSCYDYGRVYASDSFFNPVKQRHIVLSKDGSRDRWMDGKSFTKNDHNILYYM
jgi:hypothetical protein